MQMSQRSLFTLFSLIASSGAATRVAVTAVLAALLGSLIFTSCLAQSHIVKHQSFEPLAPEPTRAGAAPAPVNPGVNELEVGPGLHLQTGLEYGLILPSAGDDAHLVIDLAGVQIQRPVARPAMSVALVIDRSGSMSGDKMQNAIAAASSFIQNLRDGDVVSIVAYDDVVEELAPPTVIDNTTRPQLFARLNRLYPRGSTNLWGGLTTGIASLAALQLHRPIRLVLLAKLVKE